MLSAQAISTAIDQVANFEARGVIVSALPGSLLESTVRACHPGMISSFEDNAGQHVLSSSSIEYAANSTDGITGSCEHTLTQSELVALIAPKVTGYLAHARTVVAPAVEEFVRHLDEAVSVYRGIIAHDFEIVTQALPAPLADSSILDSIKKGETVLSRDFEMPLMGLPSVSTEGMLQMLRTGAPALDAVIDAWADAKGITFIAEVWERLFSDGMNAPTTTASAFFQQTGEGTERLLAAFLFCRTMWDNPAEGTQVSLSKYNDTIAELRLQVASRLNQRINNAERGEKAGNLVLSSYNRKIVVNQSVYVKWLQSGGSNEVLFGNALKSSPALTVKDIDADAESSKAAWSRYAAMNALNFNNRMFTKYKEAAAAEFCRLMADSTHSEMPLNDREIILRRFNTALEQSRIEETRNLFAWSLRLLGTSWFYDTDAYRILKSISDVREANPDLDVREAAAIAAIDYITYWVSGQLLLTRVN